MTPTEATQMYRTIRATQAMIFAPSLKQQSNGSSNDGEKGSNSNINNSMNSVVQDDNVELALDIYSPSERREYLVKRGNRCHPRSSSSGSSSNRRSTSSSSSNNINSSSSSGSSSSSMPAVAIALAEAVAVAVEAAAAAVEVQQL